MTRYCGTCGSSLEASALHAGRCPTCGAAFPSADEVLDFSDIASADIPTQTMAGEAGAVVPAAGGVGAADTHAGSANTTPASHPQHQHQQAHRSSGAGTDNHPYAQRQRPTTFWAFALLAAVILLLTGAAIYAMAQRGSLSIALAPFTSSSAHASSHASSSSSGGGVPLAGGPATAPSAPQAAPGTPGPGGNGVPTVTPGPSGSPTPTPTPSLSPTATATPTPAALSVSPTSFAFTACLLVNRAKITVANTGGTSLSWSASAGSSGYTVSPTSGSLTPGQSVPVTVSNILLNGTVTVSAPGARSSPQQVTITCTL